MEIFNVLRAVKGDNFNIDDMIPLSEIKDRRDLERYKKEKGISVLFSLEDFKNTFKNIDIDYNKFYFRIEPYNFDFVYLDIEKYIYRPIIIDENCKIFSPREDVSNEEELLSYINISNKLYEDKKYISLLYMLPDALRFNFFFKMFEDNYIEKEQIYNIFIELYNSCEYGFRKINPEILDDIISHQTESYKEKLNNILNNLPDEITVYRGEGDKSTPYEKGALSWTLDINIANFFACRYSTYGAKILIGKVKKDKVIDCLYDRGEKEILIKPKDVIITDTIECLGAKKLDDIFLYDGYMFSKYKNILDKLNFRETKGHNKKHSLRVLLLALIIAMEKELTDDEVELLAISCINHDRGRINDEVCLKHGKRSFEIFVKENQLDLINPEYYVDEKDLEFLMTYHCREDVEAIDYLYRNIEYKEHRGMLLKILYILKDADALDRIRFGIKELDLNYLRFDFSKKLTLISRIIHGAV